MPSTHRTKSAPRATTVLLATALALPAGLIGISTAAPARARTTCSGVPGDINGDGHADVVVEGLPRIENSDPYTDLHVFYGKSSGLTANASGTALDDQVISTEIGEGLWGGQTGPLVVADFNGDGCADIAAGFNGTALILMGGPDGISTTRATRLEGVVFGSPDIDTGGFGLALAAGDFDGDGFTDLAIGAPGEGTYADTAPGGSVFVLGGSAHGLGFTATRILTQDSPGVAGVAEKQDAFGAALASGDLNGDGTDDLVVGVPGENNHEGAIETFLGIKGKGLHSASALSENSVIVPGTAKGTKGGCLCYRGDNFGQVLAVGDVNGDGLDDVAIRSTKQYKVSRIEVTHPTVVLFAKKTGRGKPYATKNQLISEKRLHPRVLIDPVRTAAFPITIGRLDGDRYADLAIGQPNDLVGKALDAGSVTVRRGGPKGLAVNGTRFTQASPGVAGTPEKFDEFGSSLAATPVQKRGQSNLIIGTQDEWVPNTPRPLFDDLPLIEEGSITQLAISAKGPTGKGSISFSLDSTGVKGKADQEPGGFGHVVG